MATSGLSKTSPALLVLLFASWMGMAHAGLSDGPSQTDASAPAAAAEVVSERISDRSCETDVIFTTGLRYETDEASVLDVAISKASAPGKRPVVVLLTYTLQGGDTALSAGFSDRAMCFAAEHGLAAFRVSIAKNDGNETGGTKSAAAALSWINDNGDLFGANTREIVPVGFGAAASDLLALLVHDGYSMKDDYIAGLVMLSGVFSTTQLSDSDEVRRKFLAIGVPIVLGWSQDDPADLRTQNERIGRALCEAGHCPRTAVIGGLANPTSVFDIDGDSGALHERLRQLIGQLDARGLP